LISFFIHIQDPAKCKRWALNFAFSLPPSIKQKDILSLVGVPADHQADTAKSEAEDS
jgi:hypothetical protein